MNTRLYSTGEVARLLGVKSHRITYAITNGMVPEPGRFCGKRLFASEDVERLANYFGFHRTPQFTNEGEKCSDLSI